MNLKYKYINTDMKLINLIINLEIDLVNAYPPPPGLRAG